MPRTPVDAESVADVHSLAVLEELLEKETAFAQALGDVLFALEAQLSSNLPKRGCFRRRIGDHRRF